MAGERFKSSAPDASEPPIALGQKTEQEPVSGLYFNTLELAALTQTILGLKPKEAKRIKITTENQTIIGDAYTRIKDRVVMKQPDITMSTGSVWRKLPEIRNVPEQIDVDSLPMELERELIGIINKLSPYGVSLLQTALVKK